jgi:hypothetical protein
MNVPPLASIASVLPAMPFIVTAPPNEAVPAVISRKVPVAPIWPSVDTPLAATVLPAVPVSVPTWSEGPALIVRSPPEWMLPNSALDRR